MARQQGWFALILALAIASAAVLSSFPLQLGLDLRGGSQLTLEVQPSGEITKVRSEQLEAVKAVLDRRVNGLGVAESTLQTVGENQLVLQLPGVTDPTRAARVLGTTALLEFRAQKPGTEEEVQSLRQLRGQLRSVLAARSTAEGSDDEGLDQEALNQVQKELGLEGTASSEQEQLEQLLDRTNREIADRFEPTDLTGKDLVGAGRQQQQNSPGWEVTLNFNAEGGEKFAELTKSIAGTGACWALFSMALPLVKPRWDLNTKPPEFPEGPLRSRATSPQRKRVISKFSCVAVRYHCRWTFLRCARSAHRSVLRMCVEA